MFRHPTLTLKAVVPVAVFALVLSVGLLPAVRAQGGDTVPARLSAVTLNCDGTSNLVTVQWLRESALVGRTPYYVVPTADRRGLVSTFGPGPGWLAALGGTGHAPGQLLTDSELQTRSRAVASTAVAGSAALLSIAVLASASWWIALLAGLVAGCSFAGTATLAQGVWQQTATLLPLSAALAALGWGRRYPWALPLSVGLSVAAASLRPADSVLCLVLATLAVKWVSAQPNRNLLATTSGLAAIAAALPVLAWNFWYLESWLPLGQWMANQRATPTPFELSPSHLASGLGGLLVSPGRGVLWYSPILLVAGFGVSRDAWWWRSALGLQLLIAAAFYKWWGGITFGPRLLALSVWVSCFIVASDVDSRGRLRTRLATAAALITALVGLLGTFRYDPRSWELRRNPDKDPAALWDVVDSPIVALFKARRFEQELRDAPAGPFRYCAPLGLGRP